MEYNLQNIRQLAEKYFLGETTLAEEAELRGFFSACSEIPADLEACRLMFGQSAVASTERPRRELRLHKEPVRRPLNGWIAAASGIAAAILVAVFVTVNFNSSQTEDIVCYVNGQKITDRQMAIEYTQEAFDLINANLRKPAERLSAPAESTPTIDLVNEMINSLVEE